MSAVGYAVMPVVPVFDGITREINAKIGTPLEKASKKAGESIEKGVGSGVDAAADRVEKANYRVKKSSEELADAESKRSAAMSNSKAAAIDLATAEQKLADLKKDGSATAEQLAKAEADLERKRAKAETAAQNVEKAERGVEKAMAESAQASKSLEKAQNDLEAAQNGSADATRDLNKAMDEGESAGNRFELSLTKITVAATAIIGAVGAAGKAAFELGSQFDDAYDTIRIGTGASGAAFEELQQSMRNVAREGLGIGDDMGEIGSTLADLNTRLGVTGEPLEKLTTQFLQLKNMGMETDINAMTGAFTQFGVEVEDMPDMLDRMMQISQATGRSMNDLVGNLSKSGPALQEFGFGLEESAGLLGALDKAGLDADKTMMSMTKALGEFAKEGEDPQEALWGTIRGIDELIKAGNEVEAIDLANSIFGAKGGAGFVAAVQSGKFEYDDFMESLGASSDTIGGLAEATADFTEHWHKFKRNAMLALEPVAMAIFDMMVPALETAATFIEKAITKFQELGQWVQQNSAWLAPLAVVVGTFAGSIVAVQGAILGAHQAVLGVKKAIDLAAGSVKLLMAAMAANPITLIIASIAALVAGLTYFFTQTEKGRELWTKFTDTMKLAWESTQAVLTAGFEIVKAAFASLGDFIQGVWESGIKPVFDWFGNAATWLWESAIQPVFGWIVQKWNELGLALQAGFVFIESAVLQPLAAGFTWLHDSVVAPVVGWIGEKWAQLGDGMNAVKGFIVDTVFGGLKTGLDAVQNWFTSTVNGIKSTWDKLRGYLASPINFMINTVYNDGILRAWNVIAGILPGLEKGQKLAGIPAFATGGRIKGPGTGTSDDILALLSNGEHVLTAREVQKAGGHAVIEAFRKAVLSGKGFTFDGKRALVLPGRVDNRVGDLAGAAPDLLPRFATGGRVDSSGVKKLWEIQLERAHQFAMAQNGKPYQWAGPTGPGTSFDCSGFMGAIAATIQGTNPWQRYWATMSFPSPGAQGFVPGLGPGFSVGIFNGGPYGGHTAGTLSAVGPYSAVNVESGGSPSRVKYGPGAVGADHGQFTMRYHLPIGADGAFVSGGAGGVSPQEMRTGIARSLNSMIDKIMNPIVDRLPSPPPLWQGIPRGVYESGKTGLVKFVDNGIAALGDGLGTVFTAISGGIDRLINGEDVNRAAQRVMGFARGGVLPDAPGVSRAVRDPILGVNGAGMPIARIEPGEFVVNRESTRMFLPLLHAINQRGLPRFAAGGVVGGAGDPLRDLRFAAETLQIAAEEIRVAFGGGDFGYGELAAVLRNEQWAKSIVDGAAKLGKVADPTTLEGIFARSFAAETVGLLGDLGLKNTAEVTGSLVSAEKRLSDARVGHAERLADIAKKEEELELARTALAEFETDNSQMSIKDARKLADAEKAVAEARNAGKADQVAKAEERLRRVREDMGVKDAEQAAKRAEQQVKAAEDVEKAEAALADARKKSASALDWTLFDVAPQVFHGLTAAAAQVGAVVPAAGAALSGLAAAAGPAGLSLGVVVQGLKSVIQVGKTIVGLVDRVIERQNRGRVESLRTLEKVLDMQAEWGRMVDDQFAKVVDLRVEMANALIGYRDAAWKARLAQDGVARAQLEGALGVRQAEAKLAEYRASASKQAIYDFRDMSLEYDRYRWNEFKGIAQRGEMAAKVSAEMLALEADVNVARLQAEIMQYEADMAHLEAMFEQQKAAVHLFRTMQSLEQATAELAQMQATLHGYDQKGMLTASNTVKMYTELAEVEGRMKSKWWDLGYQLGGGKSADKQYAEQLRSQIAQREAEGKGVQGVALDDSTMKALTKLARQGRMEEMESLRKASALGRAEMAIFETTERQALAAIDKRRQDLEYQVAEANLQIAQHGVLDSKRRELEALRQAQAAEQYRIEGLRSENAGVREANYALAEFSAKKAAEYWAKPQPTVVDITLPSQDLYTREQVDALVRAYESVPVLEQRVRELETPAKPGANRMLQLNR